MANTNVIATCAIAIYIVGLIGITDLLVSKNILSPFTSRKIIHLGAASWLLFWPLYEYPDEDHDNNGSSSDGSLLTWRLNAVIPALKGIELFVKGAIIRDRNDKDVKTMSRSGNPEELLFGPFQFTIIMVIVGLYLFQQPVSCLIMGAVGVGDGIAPLVGKRYGKTKIYGEKTLEGSLGTFVGTIVGYYAYSMVLSSPTILSFPLLCLCALIASIVELYSPPQIENLMIPLSMYYVHETVMNHA